MATVYFFNGTQSGTADGSYADPYDLSSLASRESASSAGDIFIFKDGTYTQTSDLTLAGTNGITYQAESPLGATLDLNSFQLTTGSNALFDMTVKNLRLVGFKDNTVGIQIKANQSHKVFFEGCYIESDATNSSSSGIIGYQQTSTVLGLRATFRRCAMKLYNTVGGEAFYHRTSAPTHPFLELDSCSISVNVSGGLTSLTQNVDTFIIKNTIIYGDTNAVNGLGTNTSSRTESNNCYYNVTGASADPANGIIVADPQFVDFANGDLHLRPTSPCIGAGAST